MTMATFQGFPSGTYGFLEELSANNRKEWFDANRERYQNYYVEPALAFVSDLGPRLKAISETIQFEPRINGSLFRINRDIRFSSDKTPYKNHLDMWFWTGERKGWDSPGLFFRMFYDRLMLGAGMHHFDKAQIEAFRAASIDKSKGRTLLEAMDTVRNAGPYTIGGATRKSAPRGFNPEHPNASLLLHEGLWAEMTSPIPREAASADFLDYCYRHYKAMWPVGLAVSQALRT